MAATRTSSPPHTASVPAHIARLLIELIEPRSTDIICEPYAGSAGLSIAAAVYLREALVNVDQQSELSDYFKRRMFHGFALDDAAAEDWRAQLRSQGVEEPDIRVGDPLLAAHADERCAYTLVYAAVPAGSAGAAIAIAKDLRKLVGTPRRELLAIVLCLALLKPGGRAALVVPESVLSGATKAHHAVRCLLVAERKLDALIRLPARAVNPYPRAAVLLLSERSGSDAIACYDLECDGFGADRKRRPLLPADKLGPVPRIGLSADEARVNELPALLADWRARAQRPDRSGDAGRAVIVTRAQLADAEFDFERLRAALPDTAEPRNPHAILAELAGLEAQILQGIRDIVGRLK